MEKPLHIFISYSWDSEVHKDWTRQLTDYLIAEGGCNVTLDQYDLSTGGNMTHFMEKSVAEADKVLLILTPNYKLKADKRQGGVGMEYSMITQALYAQQTNNKKFIPILRKGNLQESAPTFIQTTLYHDMSKDDLFVQSAFELLRIIHEQPKLVKPKRGVVPDFSKPQKTRLEERLEDLTVKVFSETLNSKKLREEIESLYSSATGVNMVVASTTNIFQEIEKKAFHYKYKNKIPVTTERYNKSNSLRVQADDYFVNIDYNPNSTMVEARLLYIYVRSGVDPYYIHNTLKDSPVMTILKQGILKGDKYLPFFNKDKTVGWECEGKKYTEKEIVNNVFEKLLKEMKKEDK